MFLLGLSSSFIPYLLLSLATLVCYMQDHQVASGVAKTTLCSSHPETTEIFSPAETQQLAHQTIKQIQNFETLALNKEISASSVPYTGLPISIISSLHPLRAPPRIRAIHFWRHNDFFLRSNIQLPSPANS